MTTNSNTTLQNAPKIFQDNLEIWEKIWNNRCEFIEKFQEETYSRHILLVVPDLMEEIEFNVDRLVKNEYSRMFFHQCLAKYNVAQTKNQKQRTPQQIVAGKIKDELAFVIESLTQNNSSNSFQLPQILPLLRRIDKEITNSDVLDCAVDTLLERLDNENPIAESDPETIFLTDTIILMFWRKGRIPSSINNLAGNILDTIKGPDDKGRFFTSYPDAPEKGDISNEDYAKLLTEFFKSLPIIKRFKELKKNYQYQPKEYKVIFRVYGFEQNLPAFDIGNVRIYDPRIEKQIKIPALEGLHLDLSGVEKIDVPGHSIAVTMQGIDSTSMKLKARQTAERALAFLMKREKREQPLILSDNYSICDIDGKEVAASIGSKSGELLTDIWKEVTETSRERFGRWMNQEEPIHTIQRWLSSMDWHRQAVDCRQCTQELLNAWFAIEHLFDEEYNISLRVPEFLRFRANERKGQCIWYPKKKISFIQLIIGIIELKYEYRKYALDIAGNFVHNSLMATFHKYTLPDQLLARYVDKKDNAFYGDGFVEILDDIIIDLKAQNKEILIKPVENLRKLFFDSDYCKDVIATEFWRMKDDIYNIYRIRNMLVHRATTQSKLVEYYSARAREYSFALLRELKWRFLETKNDSEIPTLEEYFQELVINANIGLEAIQARDMQKFRKWIFK